MTLHEQKQHRLGLILVACAALSWSSAGFFTRLIPNDLMTLLFWRGIFSGSAVFLFFSCRKGAGAGHPGRLRACPRVGLPLGAWHDRASGGALPPCGRLVIYATVPFVTAAWLSFHRQKPRRRAHGAVALSGYHMAGSSWGGSCWQVLAVIMSRRWEFHRGERSTGRWHAAAPGASA